ncbi:MAG: hypothetical protein WCO55_01505 [Candidatus Falkowbacteria bacterium]
MGAYDRGWGNGRADAKANKKKNYTDYNKLTAALFKGSYDQYVAGYDAGYNELKSKKK